MDLFTDQAFFRAFHILFGIAWIGLLYYFNFVQTEYVKVADPDAKADVMKKLAPNALWWFRWAAFFTFLTGLILFYQITARIGTEIILGATMGTLMMLNVWGIFCCSCCKSWISFKNKYSFFGTNAYVYGLLSTRPRFISSS